MKGISGFAAAALLACLALLLSACGGDDDSNGGGSLEGGGSEEEFCDAGDRLRTQVSGLVSLDVVRQGTDALGDRLDEIEGTVDDLKESGREVASAEVDALDAAVEEVRSNFDALGGGQVNSETASALVNSVIEAVSAAEDVLTKLRETCE